MTGKDTQHLSTSNFHKCKMGALTCTHTSTHISNTCTQKIYKESQCTEQAGRWWRTPLIPALRRQRQADFCGFKASLIYKS